MLILDDFISLVHEAAMPSSDIPTEGLFAKVFIGWVILAVIFYIWSYLRDGKFLGEDREEEEKEETVGTANDVDQVLDEILAALQSKKSD